MVALLTPLLGFALQAAGRTCWFVGQHASDQTPDARRPERLVLTAATWTDVGGRLWPKVLSDPEALDSFPPCC